MDWAIAIEAHNKNLVRAYALNPDLPPPGSLDGLVVSGKVRYADAIDLTGVELWHTMSPFDLKLSTSRVVPSCIADRGLRHSATVYDLIPALDPTVDLADAVERRRYRTRLEVVRASDAILTLSTKVATDLTSRAEIDATRVHVIGAAPSDAFVPPVDQGAAAAAAILRLGEKGLSKPYVLAASGSHPRKNNEALIRAFAALPIDLASELQLVITGDIDAPTANHYRHLATTAEREGAVVVAGFVPDELLVTLTQGALCCVVAGLAEGFGLPIVEAQACATPVIAADISPFDELVPANGRFDPRSDAAITEALARVLGDATLRDELRRQHVATWSNVAQRSDDAFSQILARPSRRVQRTQVLRRRRPRLAFVTPLPPAPSGVAGYSHSLIRALLGTEKVSVDVFCEGATDTTSAPQGAVVHPLSSFAHVEALSGRFDHVVYALGNSHHHVGTLELLKRRGGVVIAHDVRLSNLYRHAYGDPAMLKGGFERALRAMYPGELPPGVGTNGEISGPDIERYGLLMAREAIAACDRYLVNSDFAAGLASLDAPLGAAERIATLPFAFSGSDGDAASFLEKQPVAPALLPVALQRSWGKGPPDNDVIIAHFGIVDPVKRPETLLAAHALLRESGHNVVLAFVGPIADELCSTLSTRCEELGTTAAVVFTGSISPADYRRWLHRATVAVQLRAGSNGEASAAVGECLSAALPTVVTNLGWSAELPDDAVIKVAPTVDAHQLSELLGRILGDATLRRELGMHAKEVARSATFERTARALLDELDTTQS